MNNNFKLFYLLNQLNLEFADREEELELTDENQIISCTIMKQHSNTCI